MHLTPAADAPASAPIDFQQFLAVDIRVGTVVAAQKFLYRCPWCRGNLGCRSGTRTAS